MGSIKLKIKVIKAETFWQRFSGFMFKKSSPHAILFCRCNSVHTFFMRFNLDIVYLDKENKIVKIIKSLKPFRIALPVYNTVSILEIPSNKNISKELTVGKKLIDF
ncbi:hypothetical protein AGMMS49950_11070 [Endomicrobiia bacterium]|nr:hypothetical protein AGMMS49950_11070 [Endomicrobiia bacterium]